MTRTRTHFTVGMLAIGLLVALPAPAPSFAQEDDTQGPPPPPPEQADSGRSDRPQRSRRGMRPGQGRPDRGRFGQRGSREAGGPGGPGGRGGRGGPDRQNMSPEELEKRFELLAELRPDMYERLKQKRQSNPEQVHMMLQRHLPRIERMYQLKLHDPKGFELHVSDHKLERESHELAQSLRRAKSQEEPDDIDNLTSRMRQVVAEHFDVRQKMRQHELAKLEKRIAELRKSVQTRSEKRDELIDERFNELSGADTGSKW